MIVTIPSICIKRKKWIAEKRSLNMFIGSDDDRLLFFRTTLYYGIPCCSEDDVQPGVGGYIGGTVTITR